MPSENQQSELLGRLKDHAARVDEVAKYCTDEAKTKNYLVEPLLGILGYDCQHPREVELEYTADVAGKKGEKVDYALMRDAKPVVLLEAKARGNPLGRGELEQLQRYFPHTPSAKIAVLTDGITWRWFRGQTDEDSSHLLDTSPLLIYDVREPSDDATEWLTFVTKSEFDVGNLIRVARRLEFEDKVYDWIRDTLVEPTLVSASRLNTLGDFGAADNEIQLLTTASATAMQKVVQELSKSMAMGGRSETQSQTSIRDKHEDGLDLPEDESTEDANPRPTAIAGDGTGRRLSYTPCFDDPLDLGDGRKLPTNKIARAWRLEGETWNVEKTGIAVVSSVLAELLRCEANSWDQARLASYHKFLMFSDAQPANSDWRLIRGFSQLYWYSNITNEQKAMMLSEIARYLDFNPPSDSPLYDNPRIEWWLPNRPKR